MRILLNTYKVCSFLATGYNIGGGYNISPVSLATLLLLKCTNMVVNFLSHYCAKVEQRSDCSPQCPTHCVKS